MKKILDSKALKYYAEHPVEFVEDIIGTKPDPIQAEILNSTAKNTMTSVRSGHGVGKSAVEAWAIIWFLATRPYPKIPCTAPTQHQLFDILWAEVNKWLRNVPQLKNEFIWTREKVYKKGSPEEWFAAARTAAKPDALQGFHAEHVLYIIDEASGVEDSIFEPVLGALSTPGARLLMCGNPTKNSGFFYESHHKNRAAYSTFHIDARKSPRVSESYIKTIAEMYGEDSDMFRVRVTGDFPLQDNDSFIPLHLIEPALCDEKGGRLIENEQNVELIHIACDVARFGADKTVIGFRINNRIEIYKKIRGQDTMRTADDLIILAQELINKYDFKGKVPIKIDDGGVGGGVIDRLRQIKRNDESLYCNLEIYPVSFGRTIKNAHYHDSTSYMMGVLKKFLQDGELILPNDNALLAQLSARKYSITDRGKIKLESKADMKQRGLMSPDEADCILLCVLDVLGKH